VAYYHGQGKLEDDYLKLCNSPPQFIGVDTETIGKEDRTPIGVSIATAPDTSFYFPLYPDIDPKLPWHILQDPKITKVYQNAIFDLNVLGIPSNELGPIDRDNITDTYIIAQLIGRRDKSLFDLQWEVGREDITKAADMLRGGKSMLDYPTEVVAKKCCIDAEVTLQWYLHHEDKVDKQYLARELKIIPILIDMSNRGILIDHSVRSRVEARLTKQVNYLRAIADGEGFNPGSPQQVGYILATRGVFLPWTKKKKQFATDASVLELVDDPLAGLVLDYRHDSTLLNRYIKPIANDERFYTEFNLDAVTGRISSSKRNIQNLPPGEVRSMLLPDSGIFTDIDYSQIELRILAYLSGDRKMLEIFADREGDIHQFVANFMRIIRKTAKNVHFGLIYGATPTCLRETAKIKDLRRCAQLIDMWFDLFKDAGYFIRETQREGLRDGYIDTLGGRRIPIPIGYENDEACMRKAINYKIQGSAAEIMKDTLIVCQHLPQAITVHDEDVFDGDVMREVVQLDLEHISPLETPITIKLLERWE